jgi:hypothetical protein
VTIALTSLPGLDGSKVLSIPKDWNSTWYRDHINNLLKGADVRNAKGSGGIVVSGNITSPYATIGFGPPVTLPGPVTISAPTTATTALTVNAAAGQPAAQFNGGVVISPASGVPLTINIPGSELYGIQVFATAGNAAEIALAANGVTAANGFGLIQNSSGFANFTLAGSIILQLKNTPQILGQGPVNGSLVDMTPDRGTFTLTGTGFTAAVTSTATWYRIGNLVALNVGSGMQGTSNATTFTMTGLPAAITPNVNQTNICADLENNSANIFGTAQFVSGSSTITMGAGANAGAAWTNAGTKGFANSGASTIFYLLN